MKNSTEKTTSIYALIHDQEAYVGRTTSPNLAPICYAHCRGEQPSTAAHFDLDINRPELYVLERLPVPAPIAYRYQLAWIYRLWQAGYVMLGSEETLERAKSLSPYTQTILDQISKEPLDAVLARCRCVRFADGNQEPSSESQPAAEEVPATASRMLTTRLTPAELERFDAYAKTLGMTRRDLLQYLITQDRTINHMDMDTDLLEAKRLHAQRSEKLNRRISDLRTDLSKARSSKTAIQRRHTTDQEVIQGALRTYMDHFVPTSRIPLTIEQGYYQDYMASTQVTYNYPSEQGHAILRPAAVLLGKNHSRFLVGTTDTGEEIKLRYYPGSGYLGIAPTNEQYGLRGSRWLVAWRRAEDNVMQLILALPVDVKPGHNQA